MKPSPNRIWIGIFGIWGLILTGVFSNALGSIVGPGILQAIRLQNLLHSKTAQLDLTQTQINELQSEIGLLEKSPVAQQREIRRVLGYAASDEIIFEFSSNQAI